MKHNLPAIAAALLLLAGAVSAQPSTNALVDLQAQSAGSRTVVVQSVTLPEAGFVALHDETLLSKEDPFGSVVGVSARLDAGKHDAIRVVLQRTLAPAGETLVAMPHKDTNGNGIYDFVSSKGAQDGPFTGGPDAMQTFAGNIVVASAKATPTALVGVDTPQTSTGTSLRVAYADLADGGFLAVHDSTLLSAGDALGSVVGVSAFLEKGIHRDTFIDFTFNPDKATAADGALIVMPHKDTNGNRAYDFVSSKGAQDSPYPGDADTFAGKISMAVVENTRSTGADVDLAETSTGGKAIVVPMAFLPEDGFVALHDSTLVSEEDALGSVIGVSSMLRAGHHKNVIVELGKAPGSTKGFTGTSDTITAMPHKDSNANGVYDFVTSKGAQDGPFTGGPNAQQTFAGNIVIASAMVKKGSITLMADQETSGSEARIALLDLSEGGFVALHDMTLVTKEDALGSVVGVSAKLQAGLHRDVKVPIGSGAPGATRTGKLATSETLVAMPHKDTNNNGVYDFITSKGAQDGPTAGAMQTFAGAIDISVARVTLTGSSVPPAATPTPPASPTQSATPPPSPSRPPSTDGDDGAEDGNDTPGAPIALLACALALLALARRRQ